jgi:DNA-binding transcriptional LysR family regulator
MELRDLEYFLACVHTGSITRAAQRVHTAQPTISHALARLESEIGEKLLDRSPRSPVRPTDAGQLLIEHAERALGAISSFGEALSELRGALRGKLKVAAIPSLSASLLPRALARIAKSHPGIEVSVRTLAAEKIARAVASDREDLGLLALASAATLRELDVKHLYTEKFVLVLHRSERLAKRRSMPLIGLRNRPLLLPPPGASTASIIHAECRKLGFEPQVRLTLASAEALREAARAKLGFAILPEGYMLIRDPDLAVVKLTQASLKREVLLVQRPARLGMRTRVAAPLIEAIEHIAREH